MSAIKLSNTSFKIVIQPDAPAPIEQEYDIVFLYNQKHKIIDDANAYIAARKVELAEIQALIDKAAAAGVFPPNLPETLPEPTTEEPTNA